MIVKAKYRKQAKLWLVLALVLCIGYLCVTKCAKNIMVSCDTWSFLGRGSREACIIIPLGISYYTFSAVGYLLDVYWRRYMYENNYFRFFLYTIYFPHIVQGPISRYNLLGQELKKDICFDSCRIAFGAELMLYGFFKKLVIADRLTLYLDTIYDGSLDRPGVFFLIAMICDSFMIYLDFSGYMDIVQGASQVFGISLEDNFNHPFFSKSILEFWRRWHMSLGNWFRDYVYYPITVSSWMKKINRFSRRHLSTKGSRFVTVMIPVMITWICTGLWHGTGKTYLAWGIYYGMLITLSITLEPVADAIKRLLRINDQESYWKTFQIVRTFLVFTVGRVLTSPGGLDKTIGVLNKIATDFHFWSIFDQSLFTYGLTASQWLIIVVGLLIIWRISVLQEKGSVRALLAEQNIVLRWAVIYLVIFTILIFGVYGPDYDASSFVYMQY